MITTGIVRFKFRVSNCMEPHCSAEERTLEFSFMVVALCVCVCVCVCECGLPDMTTNEGNDMVVWSANEAQKLPRIFYYTEFLEL